MCRAKLHCSVMLTVGVKPSVIHDRHDTNCTQSCWQGT